jgi:hypothetical protein
MDEGQTAAGRGHARMSSGVMWDMRERDPTLARGSDGNGFGVTRSSHQALSDPFGSVSSRTATSPAHASRTPSGAALSESYPGKMAAAAYYPPHIAPPPFVPPQRARTRPPISHGTRASAECLLIDTGAEDTYGYGTRNAGAGAISNMSLPSVFGRTESQANHEDDDDYLFSDYFASYYATRKDDDNGTADSHLPNMFPGALSVANPSPHYATSAAEWASRSTLNVTNASREGVARRPERERSKEVEVGGDRRSRNWLERSVIGRPESGGLVGVAM